MTCERHERMAELSKTLGQDDVYQKLKWIKCTCSQHKIWCDYCRGSVKCLLCRNRNGEPLNKNHIYCPRCGGTGKCQFCNGTGEMIKS